MLGIWLARLKPSIKAGQKQGQGISFLSQEGAKGKGKQSQTKSYLSAIIHKNLESKDINQTISMFY